MNDLLLQALRCRNRERRPPVWLMRQAGRYMPEYRALRAKYSFLQMCHQPELIADVTMLPIRAFGMDAAILFSDILVIPEALGVGLHFTDGVGPVIESPLDKAEDVAALPFPNIPEALHYVADAIRLLIPELRVPLIGFCGGPFTVASYMIEGKTSRNLCKTKKWMLSDPTSFHQLLTAIADHAIAYLNMQIDAGVHALQIFDSWANVLNHEQFREFSLAYFQRILLGLKDPQMPVILFCRGASVFAPQLAEISPAAISLDWNADIAWMRKKIAPHIALQGNLDPDILYAPLPVIRHEVTRLLDKMQGEPGYIFNLGHGIHPDISIDAVKTLVACVQERMPSCQNILSS
jgi:uroporphyrinogen decarboxylase